MTISLQKNQGIDLRKPDGSTLSKVTMGLGWDVAKVKKGGFFGGDKLVDGPAVDLDASAIAYDANKNAREIIYFGALRAFGGAITHTGDNVTGEGDGDDEQIKVDLSRLPADIAYVAFTVNSYRGQPFSTIENAFCRIVDDATNKELAKIDLSAKGNHLGVVMAVLVRQGNGWSFKSIAEPAQVGGGRTAKDLDAQIRKLL